MKIKVTLGLCAKSKEAIIKETINGIINQDFPHKLMEVIIVSGDNKDETWVATVDKISKTGIQVKIYYDEGMGLGAARQIVVDHARGDYIVWVDGDNVLPKDFVQKQFKFMERNPHIGVTRGVDGARSGQTLVQTLEFTGRLVYFRNRVRKLSSCSTYGSIFRTKAIRQVGGFDKRIKGAGEDLDLTGRIRAAGWLLVLSQTEFYPVFRRTWKDLWDQYFWYGYGAHYNYHKHEGLCSTPLWHRIPPVAFVRGLLLYSFKAYRRTRRNVLFLLPLHFAFKDIAWCLGYAKSHIDGYGHIEDSNKLVEA